MATNSPPLRHVVRVPARAGRVAHWPTWVPAPIRDTLVDHGVRAPWPHQVDAAELAHAGQDVVVATGTASGKSLAYQLPVLTALLADPRATALYLSPTKALAADQLRAVAELDLPGVRPPPLRRRHPARGTRVGPRSTRRYVLTNPDMLHRACCPATPAGPPSCAGCGTSSIDECHTYRGVFGSHVAQVLRRLRRVCARYGASPTSSCSPRPPWPTRRSPPRG